MLVAAGARKGIALLLADKRCMLAGAGVEVGVGGDDFGWVNAWRLLPHPDGKGTALSVEEEERGGGLICISGGIVRWQAEGD